MADEKIIVQFARPERKYVKVYHDFLDNSFLSVEEQMIFIVLKSYIDFKEDSGEVFPSIATLCKRAKMSKPRTIKAIKNLIEKGIVEKVQRGLTKTNLYTLSDYGAMWACDNVEDVAAVADNQDVKPLTAAEHIAELERMGYTVQIKEKGLDTEPTKAQSQAPINNNIYINENITDKSKSQEERYTLEEIHQLFDYEILLNDYPDRQQDVDCTMDVLHTALNTSKPTIRVSGEDKPTMIVISKLMKLDKDDLMYALDRFAGQTERVKNPTAYLLAILYSAKEQYHFDTINRVSHDMAHWEDSYHEGSRKIELERSLLQESSHLSLQQLNDKGRKHDRE